MGTAADAVDADDADTKLVEDIAPDAGILMYSNALAHWTLFCHHIHFSLWLVPNLRVVEPNDQLITFHQPCIARACKPVACRLTMCVNVSVSIK